jgi:1-acyl-sn-glycerol-3-phosphate acyltransferase
MLRWRGWQVSGVFPTLPKYVLIGAPHTSNWDFPLTLGICFALRAKIYWMGKDSLFRGPLGPLMRWLGGIPVTRSRSTSLVQQMVERYQRSDELVVAIAPEGTRDQVSEWKTGFYHIANGAGVPVVLGFLDYRRKTGGIGPVFQPTGDLERDLAEIRAFYADIEGFRPAN